MYSADRFLSIDLSMFHRIPRSDYIEMGRDNVYSHRGYVHAIIRCIRSIPFGPPGWNLFFHAQWKNKRTFDSTKTDLEAAKHWYRPRVIWLNIWYKQAGFAIQVQIHRSTPLSLKYHHIWILLKKPFGCVQTITTFKLRRGRARKIAHNT